MSFKKLRLSALASAAIVFLIISSCHDNTNSLLGAMHNAGQLAAEHPHDTSVRYTYNDILTTLPYVVNSQPQLLVWNGYSFSSYNVDRGNARRLSCRNTFDIPLLVLSLKTNFPDRFRPGSPPFELLWSGDDSIAGPCINEINDCPSEKFAPLIMFGSVPRNDSLMPSVKAFPNPYYTKCLYDYRVFGHKECQWTRVNDALDYDDLKRQIFWRGSDFSNYLIDYVPSYRTKGVIVNNLFNASMMEGMTSHQIIRRLFDNQHNIPPRWIALCYTMLTELEGRDDSAWIDARFSSAGVFNRDLHSMFEKKGIKVTDSPVDPYSMSQYRYQIDLAGGGGTTWDGTITKLLMPGVLFHQETPFKDWFYDEMIPWIHYVPVKTDLSNLWVQYLWAENNDCRNISKRATNFAKRLLSEEYMKATYQSLYVDYLDKVVRAYDDQGLKWQDIKGYYVQNGFHLSMSVECDDEYCVTEIDKNVYQKVPHVAYVQF